MLLCYDVIEYSKRYEGWIVNMLKTQDTVFVLVDVQGKLARMVNDSEAVVGNLEALIQGMKILDIPVIWLEQYPQGLGETIPELKQHLTAIEPIEKIAFSARYNEQFMRELHDKGRNQIIIAGIETHICVYQTAVHLKQRGYEVEVVADATSSRTLSNHTIGLEKMKSKFVPWTSTEMVLYELLQKAGTDEFKQIVKLIK